jgi:hypothetical protein
MSGTGFSALPILLGKFSKRLQYSALPRRCRFRARFVIRCSIKTYTIVRSSDSRRYLLRAATIVHFPIVAHIARL